MIRIKNKTIFTTIIGIVIVLILSGMFAGISVFHGVNIAEASPNIGNIEHAHEEELPQENEHYIGDGHIDHTHVVPVNENPWWSDKEWWTLLIVSVALIALLSGIVTMFLRVKDPKKE